MADNGMAAAQRKHDSREAPEYYMDNEDVPILCPKCSTKMYFFESDDEYGYICEECKYSNLVKTGD